jgi:hypothetical protein
MRVYSITDRDSDVVDGKVATQFTWDVYHIENYLLDSRFVASALNSLRLGNEMSVSDKELEDCAKVSISALVVHDVSVVANRELVSSINTKIDPKSLDIATDLFSVLEASRIRIEKLIKTDLSLAKLKEFAVARERQYCNDVRTGEWKRSVRGRDVLREFAHRHVSGTRYESFRNLVIARMKEVGHQPPGMKSIIDKVLAPRSLAKV